VEAASQQSTMRSTLFQFSLSFLFLFLCRRTTIGYCGHGHAVFRCKIGYVATLSLLVKSEAESRLIGNNLKDYFSENKYAQSKLHE